jgi:hypothetical protein
MGGSGAKKPPSLARLVFLLLLVAGLFWWLNSLTG